MSNVHKFPVQKAVLKPNFPPMNNDPVMLPGFIFIELQKECNIPNEYLLSRLGSLGFYGKIDPQNPNGFEPIPVLQYHL